MRYHSSMSSKLPLQFSDVVKDYEDLRAVNHVSFEVQPGEVFGLLGPNGAGKTTCISMITTLEEPTSGKISVFGKNVEEHPSWCKQQLGIVPQETISHGFFTLEEILRFHSGYYGVSANETWIRHLLERLVLWPHRKKKVSQLSGGMKRRLGIAKALVHKPRLLLLDEPTAGVDIELRDVLWNFVRELKADGTTILLTTHYLQEAEVLCDRVGIIDAGQIQKVGTTRDLVTELTSREITITYLEEFRGHIENPYLVGQSHTKATFRLPSHMTFRCLVESAGIPSHLIGDVAIREGSLEDVVRQIVTFDTGDNGK